MITNDSALNICKFLNDKSKIRFLSTTSALDKLKTKVTFRTQLTTKQIEHLPYFNQFTQIFLENAADRIPSNVKIVNVRKDFDGLIEMLQLYKNIRYIHFESDFKQEIKDKLPPNVKYLSFQSYYEHFYPGAIPDSVTTMIITGGYDSSWFTGYKRDAHWIPDTVTNLTIRYNYGHAIRLSPNLTHLSVNFSKRHISSIPPNLKFLRITYHEGDTYIIPPTVERLHIQQSGDFPVNFIPLGIKYLTVTSLYGTNFNVPNNLPESIQYLYLHDYTYPFSLSIFPQSLKILAVGLKNYYCLASRNEQRHGLKIKKLND